MIITTITSATRYLTVCMLFAVLFATASAAMSVRIENASEALPSDVLFPSLAPTVEFESSRVVHRVKYNDKWWMRIHTKFRIRGAVSVPCKMYAYFYDDTDGLPLEAPDGYPKYTTRTGKVYAASADFTPSLNDGVYGDFQIYVPYEALNLETTKGSEFALKYFLTVNDESTSARTKFAQSPWYKFGLKY